MLFDYKGHRVVIETLKGEGGWHWKLTVDDTPVGDCDPAGVASETRAVDVALSIAELWVDAVFNEPR